jgi:hypothetical protein
VALVHGSDCPVSWWADASGLDPVASRPGRRRFPLSTRITLGVRPGYGRLAIHLMPNVPALGTKVGDLSAGDSMLANMLATELGSSSVYQAIESSFELRTSRCAFASRPALSSATHSAGGACPMR